MGRGKKFWRARKYSVAVAAASTAVAVFSAVAIGHNDGHTHSSNLDYAPVSTNELVSAHEALPCTDPTEPINFEIFSVGSALAGLPMTATVRRCDEVVFPPEEPANFFSYIYGDCQIAEGATGCRPPLEIQTWPACQRAKADYSFEGRPLPARELPTSNAAVAVEFDFILESRIEVYTRSATIVIFATDAKLGQRAIDLLRSQKKGKPPVLDANKLENKPPEDLEPPHSQSLKGLLPC